MDGNSSEGIGAVENGATLEDAGEFGGERTDGGGNFSLQQKHDVNLRCRLRNPHGSAERVEFFLVKGSEDEDEIEIRCRAQGGAYSAAVENDGLQCIAERRFGGGKKIIEGVLNDSRKLRRYERGGGAHR